MNKEVYAISKLSRVIGKIIGERQITKVWDILDELGYETQELSEKEVNRWCSKVEDKITEAEKALHQMPR